MADDEQKDILDSRNIESSTKFVYGDNFCDFRHVCDPFTEYGHKKNCAYSALECGLCYPEYKDGTSFNSPSVREDSFITEYFS